MNELKNKKLNNWGEGKLKNYDKVTINKEQYILEDPIKIRIREYENFSINNINNHIHLLGESTGIIYLLSPEKLSEVEQLGLLTIIKNKFNTYEGLDVDAIVFEAEYNNKSDTLRNKYYIDDFNVITKKALAKCNEYIIDSLINAKQIIGIKYTYTKRYEKSFWWKLCNKRYCKVVSIL